MVTEKYTLLTDSAHAWFKVPLDELAALGIANDISECSYIETDGKFIWLEEDCDAQLWITAKSAALGLNYDSFITFAQSSGILIEEHVETAHVRNLERYFAPLVQS